MKYTCSTVPIQQNGEINFFKLIQAFYGLSTLWKSLNNLNGTLS